MNEIKYVRLSDDTDIGYNYIEGVIPEGASLQAQTPRASFCAKFGDVATYYSEMRTTTGSKHGKRPTKYNGGVSFFIDTKTSNKTRSFNEVIWNKRDFDTNLSILSGYVEHTTYSKANNGKTLMTVNMYKLAIVCETHGRGYQFFKTVEEAERAIAEGNLNFKKALTFDEWYKATR